MNAEKIPSWIKQVLMPELNEIKSELKVIAGEKIKENYDYAAEVT